VIEIAASDQSPTGGGHPSRAAKRDADVDC
jgi:hypothetical protein